LFTAGGYKGNGLFVQSHYGRGLNVAGWVGKAYLFADIEALHLSGAPLLIKEFEALDDETVNIVELFNPEGFNELLDLSDLFTLYRYKIIHTGPACRGRIGLAKPLPWHISAQKRAFP
jgi:hypothetical protein